MNNDVQHTLFEKTATFDGATFDGAKDWKRLDTLLGKVFRLMAVGAWLTLREISASVDGSEASISARLRDFRKPKFGGHTVERRRRGTGGTWEYRLEVNDGTA